MFGSILKHRPIPFVQTFLLLLSLLLVSCSGGSNDHAVAPTPSQKPFSVAPTCAQPKSAAGKFTLAGVDYGPFHPGQSPDAGVFPSDEEVDADMATLASLSHFIRIYSSTGPAAGILRAAEKRQVCVNLGIWLGRDSAANTREITAGEQLASSKAVQAITVGNETLYRGDLSPEQLGRILQQVRAKLGHTVQLTTAETSEQWMAHPELVNEVDFLSVHLYPFWQGEPIASAISALDRMYQQIKSISRGKPVIIAETGWPSSGPAKGRAIASPENQARYFKDFLTWDQQQKEPVQYFYFEAFDEGWKKEGGVGAHWGIYQQDGAVKPQLREVLLQAAPETLRERSYRDVYVGGFEDGFGWGVDSSNQQRDWLTDENGVLSLTYPAGQLWGAMFITVGPPVLPGTRPSLDLSAFHSLVAEMRAGSDSQCVRLGIKDNTQPDDGSEITVQQCLTTQWSLVALPLKTFANVDLKHLYIVFEVIFQGSSAATLDVRNVRYSPNDASLSPPPPILGTFAVYIDWGAPGNHYVPSGAMGDYDAIMTKEDWATLPHSGTTCIQITYTGATPQNQGWAGVYWQDPVNNWGKTPGPTGYNLSRASHLSFWVRGQFGGERVEFLMGGISGRYGDSLQPAVKTGVITLTKGWQQVTIDLRGKNLTHIIGGFAWVATSANNPKGATFYLDDIVYST